MNSRVEVPTSGDQMLVRIEIDRKHTSTTRLSLQVPRVLAFPAAEQELIECVLELTTHALSLATKNYSCCVLNRYHTNVRYPLSDEHFFCTVE